MPAIGGKQPWAPSFLLHVGQNFRGSNLSFLRGWRVKDGTDRTHIFFVG